MVICESNEMDLSVSFDIILSYSYRKQQKREYAPSLPLSILSLSTKSRLIFLSRSAELNRWVSMKETDTRQPARMMDDNGACIIYMNFSYPMRYPSSQCPDQCMFQSSGSIDQSWNCRQRCNASRGWAAGNICRTCAWCGQQTRQRPPLLLPLMNSSMMKAPLFRCSTSQ